MTSSAAFSAAYPWVKTPIIAGAPMRLISLAPLAVAISRAGGIGFLAGGTDLTTLDANLTEAANLLNHDPDPNLSQGEVLPLGIGFINWGADLSLAVAALSKHASRPPAAAWFFAPRAPADLTAWAAAVRETTGGRTKIWVQVGSVAEAVAAVRACRPDVLVVQGADAGGHGRVRGAGLTSLVPEVADAVGRETQPDAPLALVAAGGVADGRGVAAALALGAVGVAMGTRFLASEEANIAGGYKVEVVRAADGGVTTVRTGVYDALRGTTGWPAEYNARGVTNRSWEDAQAGMEDAENKRLYEEAVKLGDGGWGPQGRMATYAGTAVGLVTRVMPAGGIVEEVRKGAVEVVRDLRATVAI